jgi:hypothetical protein
MKRVGARSCHLSLFTLNGTFSFRLFGTVESRACHINREIDVGVPNYSKSFVPKFTEDDTQTG